MRILNIELTDDSVNYVDGRLAGRIGEHNATLLVISLPEILLNNADYHIISFDTPNGSVVSRKITSDNTKEAYLDDGKIYCTLWQELTKSPAVMLTVESYSTEDGEPVMIAKSPYIDELYFEMSADGFAPQAETGGYGLACEVDALRQMTHIHSNKPLLDGYTQTDALLAEAVEKRHAHSNMDFLNNISESIGAKADKAIPLKEGSFAKLDSDGNLRDSGLDADSFLNVVNVQGNGEFYKNNSLDSFLSVGRYMVSYKNTAANAKHSILLDTTGTGGAVCQYAFDRGLVFFRQWAGGVWGGWKKTAFVDILDGSSPDPMHIPVFANSTSPSAGATISDSGCCVNDFVLKVDGMGLSSNDFSQNYKDKLDLLDSRTYYHSGENIDLSLYYTAGLHIFHGTLDNISRPWNNNGNDLLMLVADTKRDDVTMRDTCLQYVFGNSTIMYRSLAVLDNGIIAVSEWKDFSGGDKVDKEDGKCLSSNDYTDDDKSLVTTIPELQRVCDELPREADEGDIIYLKSDYDEFFPTSSETLVKNEGEYRISFKDGWQTSQPSPTELNYIIMKNLQTDEGVTIQVVDSETALDAVGVAVNVVAVLKDELIYIFPFSSVPSLGLVEGNWYSTNNEFSVFTGTEQPDINFSHMRPTTIAGAEFSEIDKIYLLETSVFRKAGMYKYDGNQWVRETFANIEKVVYNGVTMPIDENAVRIEPDRYDSLSVVQESEKKVIYPRVDKEYCLALSDYVTVMLPHPGLLEDEYAHKITLKIFCENDGGMEFCGNVVFKEGATPDIEPGNYYSIKCDFYPIADKWFVDVSAFS